MYVNSLTLLSLVIGSLHVVVEASGQSARGTCTPSWSAAPGSPGMSSGYIAGMALWDDGSGSGPQLYATGTFASAGNAPNTSLIARWTGSTWTALGTGLQDQFSNTLAVYNNELYVGGYFNSAGGVLGTAKLAKWNGSAWSGINAQMESFENSVWGLKTHNDGSGEALYIAGNFVTINGQSIQHLARYNGSTFTAVGSGPIAGTGIPLIVFDLETWNDGSGNALYIGGRFTSVAGVPANRIAKWNGTTWSALGTGITGSSTTGTGVYALKAWNGSLYAAGQSITNAGGVTVSRIARWDGQAWHDVGGGVNGTVWDLQVFDDGSGEALYAVGLFTTAGGTSATRIAKWNGQTWSAVGTGAGANDTVFCALPFNSGAGPALYIGGSFTAVEGLAANRIARFEGCVAPNVPGDITGDGVVNVNDLLAVINAWGACPVPPPCPADISPPPSGDGVVNVNDLLMVINNWG